LEEEEIILFVFTSAMTIAVINHMSEGAAFNLFYDEQTAISFWVTNPLSMIQININPKKEEAL